MGVQRPVWGRIRDVREKRRIGFGLVVFSNLPDGFVADRIGQEIVSGWRGDPFVVTRQCRRIKKVGCACNDPVKIIESTLARPIVLRIVDVAGDVPFSGLARVL